MPRLFLILPLVLLMAACAETDAPAPAPGGEAEAPVQFRKDGELAFVREGQPVVTIDLEIAETDSARQRGMMQRTRFPEGSGMLFVFDVSEIQRFWMANTPMSLDLFFVGPDSQIVDIHKYAEPFSDEPITSMVPARFVVEVPAGFADRYGIIETDRVRWQRTGDGP